MRLLLLNYCSTKGYETKLFRRNVICITPDNDLALFFTKNGKHGIMTQERVVFELFSLLKGKNVTDSYSLREILQSSAIFYERQLHKDAKFLLILREPMDVLQSRYFYTMR